jgi:hypothetical protein
MVRRTDHDGENDKESSGYPPSRLEIETRRIAQDFHRSWVCSFLGSEDLEGTITDQGRMNDE